MPDRADDILARLANDLAEAARSARYAGQHPLANQLDGRAEVFRWAQSRTTAAVEEARSGSDMESGPLPR